MIKKLLAKLTGWQEQRTNFAENRFRNEQKDESGLAKERQQQIMENRGDKKYVSERTAPSESEILGPSDSALKGEKEETSE